MVLSVPLGQMREIILDGIERLDLVRLHQLDDVRLWTALLADLLTLGADDDGVQRLLSQHLPDGLIVRRQGYTLELCSLATNGTQEILDRKTGRYCYCPVTHKVTLGEIVDLIHQFAEQPKTLMIPEIPEGSFAKKLYSTYLSYLPKEKVAFPLKMNVDDRGSFTELVHTLNSGQVSINISKPGITKGQHWHNTKWEFFIVVAGHGLIQERKIGTDEVIEFEVSGENIQCIHMLPGYTHNIINLSETENLVTVMYCNEIFNPNKPDTFFEPVS